MSPTQRTLAHLRGLGYRCAVVEHWNSFTRRRHDLFGIIDVLALKGIETLAVQTTSGSNVSARVKKFTETDATWDMRAAGWTLRVHGWRKNAKGRYVLREVDVS